MPRRENGAASLSRSGFGNVSIAGPTNTEFAPARNASACVSSDICLRPAASLTLPRGRAGATGPNVHVVNYRHVIHSLKKKPMALLNLIYRDAMFPREPYRRCFERALERLTQREACRLTVTLLALAHEENCEAELATAIEGVLKAGRLPDPDKLKPRFAPDPAEMPRIDAVKLSMMLNELRLPTINQLWQSFAKRADTEGWTAARFLAALVEHELAERGRRRIQRHLGEARLLAGKNLASFDFNAVPTISKAQVSALAAGDAWLTQGANPEARTRPYSPPHSADALLAGEGLVVNAKGTWRLYRQEGCRCGAASAGGCRGAVLGPGWGRKTRGVRAGSLHFGAADDRSRHYLRGLRCTAAVGQAHLLFRDLACVVAPQSREPLTGCRFASRMIR